MADEPKTLRIRLGPQGRIVIPAQFRRAMGTEAGEPLVATRGSSDGAVQRGG